MPAPNEILRQLAHIAMTWRWLAILWHFYFAALIVILLVPPRSSRRVAGIALALPLASVSILAWWSGNPFNGVVLATAAALLIGIAWRFPGSPVRTAAPLPLVAGVALALFGWIYPHFVATGSIWSYLYATPLGLLPCPTFSLIAGSTIILDGLEGRAWGVILAMLGLWYGSFGAIRLGVGIDWILLVGSVVLLLSQIRRPDRRG